MDAMDATPQTPSRKTVLHAVRGRWFWGERSALGLAMLMAAGLTDQSHKWWMFAVQGITESDRLALTPFLDLVFVKNTGISYGLLDSNTFAGQLLLAGFAAAAAAAFWVWLARGRHTRSAAISLGLIMGGAMSNAADRLIHGGVADFFSLHAFGLYWYVFNLADVAIVVGVAGLLYDSLVASRNDAAKA